MEVAAERDGPPFGDGPWWEGPGSDGLETVRSKLHEVVVASLGDEDGALEAEYRLWTASHKGVPWWQWVSLWASRRAAVLRAAMEGYVHSSQDIRDYVDSVSEEKGRAHYSQSACGSFAVYDFEDASWLAFKRCGVVVLPSGAKVQPWQWRQLDERPEAEVYVESEATPLSVVAARKGDEEGARMMADAAEVIDTYSFGSPPEGSVCCICGKEFTGKAFKVPHGEWAHVRCWGGRQRAKNTQGFEYQQLAERQQASRPDPTPAGAEPAETSSSIGRTTQWTPDPTASAEDSGQTHHSTTTPVESGDPAGTERAPRIEARVSVGCTNPDCSTGIVMPVSSWNAGARTCRTCGGKLIGYPAGVGRPLLTADLLPERPEGQGEWACRLCGRGAWEHYTYRPGGELQHDDCQGFVPPHPESGSFCVACGSVSDENYRETGSENRCEECGADGSLVAYDSGEHLDMLIAKAAADSFEPEKGVQPDVKSATPEAMRPKCEACGEPAAIKFNRAGKKHPVLLACVPCANNPEIAGRRRSFTEI